MCTSTVLASLLLFADPKPVAGGVVGASPFVTLTTGGIRGRVTDSAGASLTGATVLVSTTGGRTWLARTGPNGTFQAGLLPPGRYALRIDMEGYLPMRLRDLVVRANTWLIPGEPVNGFICGNGPGPLLLRTQAFDRYESSFAGTSNWTGEELSRLPVH